MVGGSKPEQLRLLKPYDGNTVNMNSLSHPLPPPCSPSVHHLACSFAKNSASLKNQPEGGGLAKGSQ